MKLGIICDSHAWGGLEMNVCRLACRLKQRGNEITLFSSAGSRLSNEALKENIKLKNIIIKLKYFDIKAAYFLARELRKEKKKVLIINTSPNIYLAVLTKIILKLIFFSKLNLIYIQHMELGVTKKGIVQTFLYRQLAAWVCPLNSMAKQVCEKTYMAKEKIHIIPLGIHLNEFMEARKSKLSARDYLKLDKEQLLVGIIGRLDPLKGQEFLIKALPHIHKIFPEVNIAIIGNETMGDTRNYLKYLTELTATLNLNNFVHFISHVENPEFAFAALDIFVLTTDAETYGMVTLEAMAAGLPIVATNSGGTPELLGNGEFGLLIPPHEEVKLAEAINKLLSDKDLSDTYGKKAQQASMNYSYQRQCELMEQLVVQMEKN